MSKRLSSDPRFITDFLIGGIKEQENFYGPVFSKMVAKFATEFLAKKIGDENHTPIDRIEDSAKYIMQNIEKYPNGFCALIYGTVKAENNLQGGVGSGARAVAKEATKRFAQKAGLAAVFGKMTDTTEAWKKQIEFSRKTNALLEESITFSGDGDSVSVEIDGCFFGDACNDIAEEGIRKLGGNLECPLVKGNTALLDIMTGAPHDYEILSFHPPKCTVRAFKVQQ